MGQSRKLFVLVNKRLSRSQQSVQACHAVIEFALKHGSEWKHQSLVLLGIDGQDELDEWYFQLATNKNLKHAAFFEPYWDDCLTAVACYGCDDIVKELELL